MSNIGGPGFEDDSPIVGCHGSNINHPFYCELFMTHRSEAFRLSLQCGGYTGGLRVMKKITIENDIQMGITR